MKLISWNVNGLRACLGKGFMDYFQAADADFFCLQETKLQQGQVELELPGYHQYWNYAEKKGYSGTAIFAKEEALSVRYGLGIPELDTEGRLITLEYPNCWVVTCYTPNAQEGLKRLDHRMAWEDAFRAYLKELETKKPVIFCGDLNVAHQEIDLKNPKTNRKKPARVGKIITSSAGYRFKVTSSKVKNPEVALYRPGSGRKEVKIGTKVTINGISYSVTSVCERAFRSNKRVKKVSLGSRVDKIGKEAFANCRNIKVLYIYSPRLKASDIGENAFKGINKRVKISVPKAKMKEYKELFREKGLSKQTSVTTGKVQ